MKKLKDIKGIFLDLGGTLVYPPSGSWLFSRLAYKYFPREKLAEPENMELVRRANMELESDHLLSTTGEERERFARFYRTLAQKLPELGITSGELEEITDDKVYNMANFQIFDDNVETLEDLSKKYRLVIISDNWPSVWDMLEQMDIGKYLHCATYSFQLNAFKPSPAMYRDALSKMGLPPENTLFVDDLPGNVLGAQKEGICPVLIRHPVHMGLMGHTDPIEGVHSIDRISGLLELLDI